MASSPTCPSPSAPVARASMPTCPTDADFVVQWARIEADVGVTMTGDLIGTLRYMSPEQITAPERVGPETDLWSLAVISFECLVGRPAFAGESVADVLQAITHRRSPSASKLGAAPPSYDHWFSRATAKRAEDRFPSAPMLVRELETALGVDRLERPGAGDTVGLDTVQRATRAKHWAKTLPVVSAAVLVFGAVALWQLLPLGAWGSSSPADATNERELPQAEVDEVAISPPSGDEIEFLRGAAAATSLQRSARTGGLAGGSTPMAAEPGPRSKLPEPQSPPGGNRKIRSRPSRPPPSSEDAVWTERL